jgi:hypothetical protein
MARLINEVKDLVKDALADVAAASRIDPSIIVQKLDVTRRVGFSRISEARS